jgi:hypothetical protein
MPTATTTTESPCTGECQWIWYGFWFLTSSTCAEGCSCVEPAASGIDYGDTTTTGCDVSTTTTTTTTTTSSSSTSTSSTTSSSTSSTSSTTTTTTTTAAPCTGGCTWRWDATGQAWLKYGTGDCSTGCSCQSPTSPGTTDGEYQTVSCASLTCLKCCGSANCCPIDLSCCDPPKRLPRILYLTFADNNSVWPCADGETVEFHYSGTSTGGGYKNHSFGRVLNLSSPFDPAKICLGEASYTLGDTYPACNGTKRTDCDTDVYLTGTVLIKEPLSYIGGSCKIELSLQIDNKTRAEAFYPCVLQPCAHGTTYVLINGVPSQDMNCDPINYTFQVNVQECYELYAPTFCNNTMVYFGATGTDTVDVVITE